MDKEIVFYTHTHTHTHMYTHAHIYTGFPGVSGRRICQQCRRPGYNPWVRKFPWRREWQPTPVFLPGEVHGEMSLVGYSPWGHKESNTTKRLTHSHECTHTHMHTHTHTYRHITQGNIIQSLKRRKSYYMQQHG